MSYNVDELFLFTKFWEEWTLTDYLKKDDPTVTEIEIPAEYRGAPVTRILSCFNAARYLKRVVIPPSISAVDAATFYGCKSLETVELPKGIVEIGSMAFRETNLKSVTLPKSLQIIGYAAFAYCENLESVIFKSDDSEISIMAKVFWDCHKLPADVTLMGLVNSRVLSAPFDAAAFNDAFDSKMPTIPGQNEYRKYLRPDVLELAIKNDCFRSVDMYIMLKFLVKKGDAGSLRLAEELGLVKKSEPIDGWIETSAREGETELTAYLLDLKNRKFGFEGGSGLEL